MRGSLAPWQNDQQAFAGNLFSWTIRREASEPTIAMMHELLTTANRHEKQRKE
jgi:hypothetical protein